MGCTFVAFRQTVTPTNTHEICTEIGNKDIKSCSESHGIQQRAYHTTVAELTLGMAQMVQQTCMDNVGHRSVPVSH